jgi:hypothetical protein
VGRFQVTDRQDRPEISARAAAMWQQAGINVRVDTGEVHFTAETDAGPRKGYAMVQTVFLPMMGSPGDGNWFVTGFHGYLATADREGVARAVMAAMVGGFRMNPRWVAGMVQTAGEVSRITYETQEQINGMFQQTYANRQASEDRTAQRWAQANRGLTVGRTASRHRRSPGSAGPGPLGARDDRAPLITSQRCHRATGDRQEVG